VETDDRDINFNRHFFGFTQLYYPEAANLVAAEYVIQKPLYLNTR
jgi:hypothetical protein